MVFSITKFIAHPDVFDEEKNKNTPTKGEVKRIIIWYILFLLVFPYTLSYFLSFDFLRYYFAVVDIIANIFSNLGNGDYMGRLYSPLPSDLTSYLSTNFLSLVALVGVSWTSIYTAMKYKNMWIGIFMSMILFSLTYLLPIQSVGYVIRHYIKLDDMTHLHVAGTLFTGFIFLLILLAIENGTVYLYFKLIQSAFTK